MQLQSGTIVSAYKHYAGSWAPASRITLSGGTLEKNDAFFPCDDWRHPSDVELDLLIRSKDGASLEDVIQVFTVPDRLHREFWELDLDKITEWDSLTNQPTAAYAKFIERLADFLKFIEAPLTKQCLFRTVISAPGLSSTAYDPIKKRYLGLRVNPDPSRSSRFASINFGEQARALVWLNPSLRHMRERMQESKQAQSCLSAAPDSAAPDQAIAAAFMSTCPEYPVVRFRLKPREGFFSPLNALVHDGYTIGMTEPDFNLVAEPMDSRA